MGKALVDANVLVAVYREDDKLHGEAVDLVSRLKEKSWVFVVTNLVLQEIATVLSMRVGMKLARKFLIDYGNMVEEKVFLDEELERQSWRIFEKQEKKGTSFVDCANLAVIEKYKLDGILTFDEFYQKKLVVGGLDHPKGGKLD